MDGDSKKVFVPSIGRNSCTLKNNLYDIISKDVIKPETFNHEVQGTCDFQPTGGKLYAPKKKSKLKVKTVRDIRHLYEKDILETLPYELERQQKLLLKKIRDGHAKDENTKKVALNLLNSDKPISRSSWQMLMNINPKGHNHSSQFVLWNGKCIQVNGSSGGKNKFIFNYDIYKDKESYRKVAFPKSKNLTKRRGLLRDSLNIRFKPGPLTKKKELDYSYQKYHVGEIKLVNLPKLGLVIKSSYGTALEPTVTTFLQNLREEDGTISEKWAEFSVSMLGKVTNEEVQIGTNNCITFNLNYKCDQKRILMRHNIDKNQNAFQNTISSCTIVPSTTDKSAIMSEVQNILDRMLDTVEISLKQEAMYSGVDESREILTRDCCSTSSHIKEKVKRKYNELDRLDVTVIRLSENRKDNISEPCRQLFCSLGCICDSLECAYSLKEHCGRTDCMFGCKCDFSKYRIPDFLEGDCAELLPGLFILDKKINDRLSKEEQKFHQTVLVTDEKSILLKSKRRNWKTSKKYADFYSSMRLRNENKNQRILTIVDTKLKCENIEPWCMVHNLYKCFCKGKFTQTVAYDLTNVETNINYDVPMENEGLIVEDSTKIEPEMKDLVKPDINEITLNNQVGSSNFICARVLPYEGRKFTNGYYLRTNEKILEMEKNDKKLHAKMLSHMSQSSENELADEINTPNNIVDVADTPFKLDDLLNNILHEQESLMHSMSVEIEEEKLTKIVKELKTKRLPNKTKLVEWLESTYKKYKERVEKGMWKTLLSPPKAGKVALYPWDFILSRYQERKNLFLISIQKPFRIFMAVDARNPFFDRCINVSYIPQSKINEYPIMVRNLINNVKDLKDNFCILCGLSHCWELIGSVTKVNENKIIQTDAKSVAECISYDEGPSKNKQNNSKDMTCDTITEDKVNKNSSTQLSKWFLMTVEEDFSEIQFYKRGFFVKYDSIIKAIQVARRVGKTVRLSSQRCNDGGSSPQFGIYATPNNNENSVFIGPYEKEEPLGIETLKNSVNVEDKNRTRGVWIIIDKIDNLKVIDNPLSFIPFKKDWHNMVTLENDIDSDLNKSKEFVSSSENTDLSDECISPVKKSVNNCKAVKIVKPIKIRKTNGFYHLAPNSLLKQVCFQKCIPPNKQILQLGDLASSSSCVSNIASRSSKPIKILQNGNYELKNNTFFNKPIAEIAPQIKITDIASLCNNDSSMESRSIKSKGSMFVLKPEEINKRLANNFFRIMHPAEGNNIHTDTISTNVETVLDVESFLDSSVICTAPVTSDVYVISDDESDCNISISSVWRNVWISCSNIKGIGWISGKRNNENKLSFEFPGFAFTDYYEEKEAFNKINQVFSRKVYVPKDIIMEWQVIESEEDLRAEHKLEHEDLCSDFVMTRHGLIHKNNLLTGVDDKIDENEVALTTAAVITSVSIEYEDDDTNSTTCKQDVTA